MREELVFIATCDIPGHVRGKGLSGVRTTGETTKGRRLDPQQLDDVGLRSNLGWRPSARSPYPRRFPTLGSRPIAGRPR
jgi:hypothetical protein